MKIAIYLNNQNISEVNCVDMTVGNPGIGGTEYCFLLLAQMYKKCYPENKVILITNKQAALPTVDQLLFAKDVFEGAETAKKENADIFLISAVDQGSPLPKTFFDIINRIELKTIIWGHNFYLSNFCNMLSKCNYVRANVFVGRQQYDRYIDHKIIKKSTYIYNMYPANDGPVREKKNTNNVTYVGSLVPMKGFQVLAKAWKQVIEKVPDAQLYVIGSGKLYGRNSKLGKYNIAEQEYENSFIDGLLDENGKIMSSVHFLGVMGAEKKDIILRTAVGVPNPTGRTETFGISALDFESLGVPVVTIAKDGFLDTVVNHETGLLYSDPKYLAENIVTLLLNKTMNEGYGKKGVQFSKSFDPEIIIQEWNQLFWDVSNERSIEFRDPENFMDSNLKKYRWCNRKIKNRLHFEYPISVIGIETIARKLLRVLGK